MKKSNSFSIISAVLWLGFGLFLPLLISLGVVATSYTANSPINWKIAIAFLVLYNGWWFYVLYQGARVKLARREAERKQKADNLSEAPSNEHST